MGWTSVSNRWFVLLVFALLPAHSVVAQDEAVETNAVRIELVDGSTLIGTIESETETTVVFRTTSGVTIDLPKDRIKNQRELTGRIVDGEYRRYDPNRTRLFFAPTARAIGRGRGYVAAYEVFLPFVAFGAGEHLSLAGGMSLVPGIGIDRQLIYAAPKVTLVSTPQTSMAAGLIAGTVASQDGGYGALAFGLSTFGGPEQAVTLGAGIGRGSEDDQLFNNPIFLLGGESQLSNSVKLLSENYIYLGDEVTIIFSGGIRFFNDTLAADLGLVSSPELLDEGGFPFLPWLGFAYNFAE